MENFKYNNNLSYDENFQKWFVLNSEERDEYGQKPYTIEEASKVFHAIFKDALSHSIRVNAKGILEEVLVVDDEIDK